jgi:hypothetical protein
MRFSAPRLTETRAAVTGRLEQPLARLGVSIALERQALRGHPIVALVPEYHGRSEGAALISELSTVLGRALSSAPPRLFVEAWQQGLSLRQDLGNGQPVSGLESPTTYPISRACWDLLALLDDPPARGHDLARAVRQTLLGDQSRSTVPVGEHETAGDAQRALATYTRAWSWMVERPARSGPSPPSFPCLPATMVAATGSTSSARYGCQSPRANAPTEREAASTSSCRARQPRLPASEPPSMPGTC